MRRLNSGCSLSPVLWFAVFSHFRLSRTTRPVGRWKVSLPSASTAAAPGRGLSKSTRYKSKQSVRNLPLCPGKAPGVLLVHHRGGESCQLPDFAGSRRDLWLSCLCALLGAQAELEQGQVLLRSGHQGRPFPGRTHPLPPAPFCCRGQMNCQETAGPSPRCEVLCIT